MSLQRKDVLGLEEWFPVIFGATAAVLGAGVLVNTRLLGRLGLPPFSPWPARLATTAPTVRVFLHGALYPAMAVVLWLRLAPWSPATPTSPTSSPTTSSTARFRWWTALCRPFGRRNVPSPWRSRRWWWPHPIQTVT